MGAALPVEPAALELGADGIPHLEAPVAAFRQLAGEHFPGDDALVIHQGGGGQVLAGREVGQAGKILRGEEIPLVLVKGLSPLVGKVALGEKLLPPGQKEEAEGGDAAHDPGGEAAVASSCRAGG